MSFFLYPVELLAQVFMYLDTSSVLAVRQSCKTFYSVTKTRQFWYNRVNQLIKTHYVCPPEESLDEYNVDELERWVTRRCRSRDVFTNHSQPSFRKRTLDQQKPPRPSDRLQHWDFIFIPGGRWLLTTQHPANVYFVDLDSPQPLSRLLFDPREIDDAICEALTVKSKIWIDRGAPRLSFRLALVVFTKDLSRTYICQVDLAGHGANATLVASNIAILRNMNLHMRPLCTALNDSYLVHVWCERGGSTTTRTGVYDYRQALGCLDYPMAQANEHSIDALTDRNMDFIFKDIFAMSDQESHSLLISEIGPSASLNLLHRIDMYASSWSTIRWTPSASIITMMNAHWDELQGLVIPHDSNRPPTIVELGRCQEKKPGGHIYSVLGFWWLWAMVTKLSTMIGTSTHRLTSNVP
ncbi:hypothetical protein Agabi119p4_10639 [Agaricus bisporus var. burnettii]|uniref:F-box domain-containing protein n=1 Tax=Agaricus bisporus var. burnettii TaxID=192524 RepID=A0A8H7EX50_AGABI|nr:hypothetical protein Agabi119p4_10639 [Agaricus bisporus var. burnettii]